LDSIKELIIPHEVELSVIVVDNASTDNSVEELKNIKFKNIQYEIVENDRNLLFAAGNNVGLKHAINHGADYAIVLNNDTFVDKKLLIELIKIASANPRVGIICPKIYFAKGFEFHKDKYKNFDLGKVIWYAGGDVDWNNVYATNHGVDEIDKGQFNKTGETDFATGACMLIRILALKKVGLFNEKYCMYLEDADLSMRMKKNGWEVFFAPGAVLWHKVAQSSTIGGDLNDYFTTRNRMLFGLKYAPLRTKLALIRESIGLLKNGRKWQKKGVIDFYTMKYGKGSWK
jgi:hypothetical protein